jgi:hypothetical protein
MKNLLKSFVCGEEGFLLSTEGVLTGTVLIIGLIVGIASIRDAVVQELDDFATAVAALDQSYTFTTVNDTSASTEGAAFTDAQDAHDTSDIDVTVAGDSGETP